MGRAAAWTAMLWADAELTTGQRTGLRTPGRAGARANIGRRYADNPQPSGLIKQFSVRADRLWSAGASNQNRDGAAGRG